ncbi:HutD/Ves family protein [Subtercola frigoramans]|uniref:Environmental stress-induced protein Ves n=1 Tax=Subtercola frigoramans TaxID=120298 RepID=A0ABS2L0V4_9MICO|nr:HutD family protein [Subtercola frigoramans]MBM7470715.1 environmental stress-induced protein Ves [Subtercola frigoramans]
MPTPHVIRFTQLSPTSWANGAGTTTEVLRSPATGEFDVRLSIATVGAAAPFSPLPGIDRALMVLATEGLDLVVDGSAVSLAQYEVLTFGGEAAVSVAGGPDGHDLNLMVRHGTGTPVLEAVKVDGRYESPADTVAIVVLDGSLSALGAPLAFGDTIFGGTVAIRGTGVVAVASIRPQ